MPQDPEESSQKPSGGAATVQAFASIFTTLVETFGWPGAIVVLTFWFVVWYATDEQKHRIIETYILGTGIAHTWPIIMLSVTFAVTVLAQRRWYLKKMGTFVKELEREGEQKSLLQGKKINKSLPHATTKTKPGGK